MSSSPKSGKLLSFTVLLSHFNTFQQHMHIILFPDCLSLRVRQLQPIVAQAMAGAVGALPTTMLLVHFKIRDNV